MRAMDYHEIEFRREVLVAEQLRQPYLQPYLSDPKLYKSSQTQNTFTFMVITLEIFLICL